MSFWGSSEQRSVSMAEKLARITKTTRGKREEIINIFAQDIYDKTILQLKGHAETRTSNRFTFDKDRVAGEGITLQNQFKSTYMTTHDLRDELSETEKKCVTKELIERLKENGFSVEESFSIITITWPVDEPKSEEKI